jgi:pyruvate formate lyase activating enzyme
VQTLRRAREIGYEAGLRYVYEGNIPGEGGESTYCPNCKQLLIMRFGFKIMKMHCADGRCFKCGYTLEGVWA